MIDTTRDWSGFAMQLAVFEMGPTGPVSWFVVAPGSGNTPEEAANYAAWRAWCDGTRGEWPSYRPMNEWAASNGWPLPFPAEATPLQLRPYDRTRFPAGRIITDRREAAILAPGDFPDVDTSVDPPVFYAQDGGGTWERLPVESRPVTPKEVAAATPARGTTARRVPAVGDRVVVDTDRTNDIRFVHGAVTAVVRDASGATPGFAQVNGSNWGYVVGWLA